MRKERIVSARGLGNRGESRDSDALARIDFKHR